MTSNIDNKFNCDYSDAAESKNLHIALLGGSFLVSAALAKYYFYNYEPIISMFSVVIAVSLLAWPILTKALKNLTSGRIRMNELVALALLASIILGKYYEAGIIAFIMLIVIAIETKTATGTSESIESLIKLTPVVVRKLVSEKEENIHIGELDIGTIIRARPGENFPVDGIIIAGSSAVNQASITGESLPIDKVKNSDVFAGTENLTGAVDVKVTRIGPDTTMGKVKELIQNADKTRVPIHRLTDQYINYYIPSVIMLAVIIWFFSRDPMQVVYVLVIACPCALVVAVPSAILAAIAASARMGVLIKDAGLLEVVGRTKSIIFDKTGTLTEGKLKVASLNPNANSTLTELLTVAVNAEPQSNHPVAEALRELAREANIELNHPDAMTEFTGQGIQAEYNADRYYVGRKSWFKEQNLCTHDCVNMENEENPNISIVYVAKNTDVLGWIGLSDTIRTHTKASIEWLSNLGIKECSMVTGDNPVAAKFIAQKAGIHEIKCDCLPETKAQFVETKKATLEPVMFVGDGINDAPAIAAGNIGIAMGAMGSDIAMNSASIALMNNNLKNIPALIELARKTKSIININLLIGIGMIVGGLMFFIFGNQILNDTANFLRLQPTFFKSITAAGIHIIGALMVLFNSARLFRFGNLETSS